MPSRQSVKKVETKELQGDDSYVVYRPITVGEIRELQKQSINYQKQIDNALADYAKEHKTEVDKLTETQRDEALSKLDNVEDVLHFMDKALASNIIEWNWVDFDDKPLDQPRENWQVMDKLTSEEYSFISGLFSVNGNEEAAKN